MTKTATTVQKAGERLSRPRQRQKLIDACITALHQHGPSRTTIDKVVSIADMSPGIVNFYFETKAALLVAALDHLAVEFETRVLEPVKELLDKPMAALERLIDLYLDPDVASPRKVCVWYSFWGESSARREYFEICGKRDIAFAALVQDLVAREINITRMTHLDADAVALGLIGCLEMMWQEIAFKEQDDLDRETAKRRCRAYLRSVFPARSVASETVEASNITASALAADLAMFRRNWQFAGAAADLPCKGNYIAWQSAIGRNVIVHDANSTLRAFVNTCLHRPHALLHGQSGCVGDTISCEADDSVYALDGTCRSGGKLPLLHLVTHADALYVVQEGDGPADLPPLSLCGFVPSKKRVDYDVQANWRLVMEHWADTYLDGSVRVFATAPPAPKRKTVEHAVFVSLTIGGDAAGFSRHSYGRLHAALTPPSGCMERALIWPNLCVDRRPDGMTIRQVVPLAATRSRISITYYKAASENRILGAMFYLAMRLDRSWQREDLRIIESTQMTTDWPQPASRTNARALESFLAWMRAEMHDTDW